MSQHLLVIVGHLGSDPELRYTPNGTAVTNLNIATNRQWKDQQGEDHKETCWFKCATWGAQAETCAKYLKKGRLVYVEAQLRPDENGNPSVFEKKDGTYGSSYEANARVVRFLTSGNGGGAAEAETEEEVPF